MDLLCPRCGAKSSEKEFIETFCIDCYPFNFKIPKISDFSVVECKRCGKMLFKGEWQQFNKEKIAHIVESKCKGDFESVKYDFDTRTLVFCFSSGSAKKYVDKKFELDEGYGICPDCSRLSGGYFEAIVQLRGGNKERLRQYANSLEKRLKEKTFVSKVEEKKEGIDLYVGSSKAVLADMRDKGIKCVMSSKIFGRDKEGKTTYRTTFLMRL